MSDVSLPHCDICGRVVYDCQCDMCEGCGEANDNCQCSSPFDEDDLYADDWIQGCDGDWG